MEVSYTTDIKKEPCGEKVASYVQPLYNYRLLSNVENRFDIQSCAAI